jgi:DNA mismatch repair protein MutL
LPYDQVDVNAHPAKTEIRFRQQSLVHDLIRDSIEHALVRTKSIPVYEHRSGVGDEMTPGTQPFAPSADAGSFPNSSFDFTPPGAARDPFQRAFNYPFREGVPQIPAGSDDHHNLRIRADMLLGAPTDSSQPFHPKGVRILGQIQESYIIAVDSYGLLIIDQHVAHERILYEKLANAIRSNEVETQGLLIPLTLDLPPHQLAMLRRVMTELTRNGFQVEHFGGSSVIVRGIPAIARIDDVSKLLMEILEGLEQEDRSLDVERILDRIAVSTACRAAIKVNMPLTMEKMQWLLDELASVRIPTNCPHGRPIILRFSLYEIERNFGRI